MGDFACSASRTAAALAAAPRCRNRGSRGREPCGRVGDLITRDIALNHCVGESAPRVGTLLTLLADTNIQSALTETAAAADSSMP
jgi:hypothetical protein